MKQWITLCIAFLSLSAQAQSYKGLYVDHFAEIMGNAASEDSLLTYAQAHHFTTLTLYGLHTISLSIDITDVTQAAPLAHFIAKAKNNYSVTEVSAIAENFNFFKDKIYPYNQQHADSERFDVYNLEFEFWVSSATDPGGYLCDDYLIPNGYPCNDSGAFAFYRTQLHQMDSLAHADNCLAETYIGWPDSLQAVTMLPEADRILLHAYVADPANTFSYTESRLGYFGSTADTAQIAVIFESEPAYLGPWLSTHGEEEVFPIYQAGYDATNFAGKNHIHLLGQQWFDYTDLPYTLPAGIARVKEEKPSLLFKNNTLSIHAAIFPATLSIINSSGQLIQIAVLNKDEMISVSCLIPGLYIARLATNNQEIRTKFLVYQ